MTETELLLSDRREEFEQHWNVVSFLETRAGERLGVSGAGNLERRHVAISKAGLLVHLYNIVEAIMVHQLGVVMRTLAEHRPSKYTKIVLKEWIRQKNGTEIAMGDERRLIRSVELVDILLERAPVSVVDAPTASGNWDDKKIDTVSKRLGCRIRVSSEVRRAARSPYFNDQSRMFYVKKRRNDLAHGSITFEDGGREKTLVEIRELSGAVLDYMEAVVSSFSSYLEELEFLEHPVCE